MSPARPRVTPGRGQALRPGQPGDDVGVAAAREPHQAAGGGDQRLARAGADRRPSRRRPRSRSGSGRSASARRARCPGRSPPSAGRARPRPPRPERRRPRRRPDRLDVGQLHRHRGAAVGAADRRAGRAARCWRRSPRRCLPAPTRGRARRPAPRRPAGRRRPLTAAARSPTSGPSSPSSGSRLAPNGSFAASVRPFPDMTTRLPTSTSRTTSSPDPRSRRRLPGFHQSLPEVLAGVADIARHRDVGGESRGESPADEGSESPIDAGAAASPSSPRRVQRHHPGDRDDQHHTGGQHQPRHRRAPDPPHHRASVARSARLAARPPPIEADADRDQRAPAPVEREPRQVAAQAAGRVVDGQVQAGRRAPVVSARRGISSWQAGTIVNIASAIAASPSTTSRQRVDQRQQRAGDRQQQQPGHDPLRADAAGQPGDRRDQQADQPDAVDQAGLAQRQADRRVGQPEAWHR